MKGARVGARATTSGRAGAPTPKDNKGDKVTSTPKAEASSRERMARWLSFFAEYNFTVEYKPGKQNVLADALSRRPDYELAHLAYLESPLYELIREAYADDDDLAGLVEALSAPNKAVELTA
ncbi:hypothetical protein PR003_g17449 [Phytophthora rubi]|uniref:Reverse transcriptase RNase H-like domain-containing protein n=1 Tax=Phytophthora rubi TaxID=129364 RepID=A0A6A4EQB8_9STRA|nr:hypothetical protein PR003_g17449 [Phytophthora rubi]